MQAEWIWYRGDYEIMLVNKSLTERYEREVFVPPFWRMEQVNPNVKFVKEFVLSEPERIEIRASGRFNVILDETARPENKYVRGFSGYLDVAPGSYRLTVSVYDPAGLPALYVRGKTVVSDEGFLVTCNDHRWVKADCCGYTDIDSPPREFPYERVPYPPAVREALPGGRTLWDFGREIMATLRFQPEKGCGRVRVWYGESREEALDTENCELTDELTVSGPCETPIAKAFRYLLTETPPDMELADLTAVSQTVPQARRSSFRCSEEKLERIYETSLYTLSLNTRDFFLDGIKRDRWVWSGDAYQCYLMNYYSFFDLGTVKRTMRALAGKSPVRTFINHIMEYSFYWLIGLYDYYRYTGDVSLVEELWPIAEEIAAFAATRKTERGLLCGRPEDWVFVDWAELDNSGEVSAEALIYWKALCCMGKLAHALGRDASRYERESRALRRAAEEAFWDEGRGAYRYAAREDALAEPIKRHPNIFAILYGFADEARRTRLKETVLKNDAVEAIVTPYMRFYELAALCETGEHRYVLEEMLRYWGGMLDEGATSFWEKYDSREGGAERYAMYGRGYGKSLCHAWGAGPLYLIGRYFVGVEPAEDGYGSFVCRPHLGGLTWFSAEIPVKEGSVKVEMTETSITIVSGSTPGRLELSAEKYRPVSGMRRHGDRYVLSVLPQKEYRVEYRRRDHAGTV